MDDVPAAVMPFDVRPKLRARLVAVLPRPGAGSARTGPASRRRRGRISVIVALFAFVAIQALTNLAIREEWCPVRDPLYFDKLALFRANAPEFFEPRPPDSPTRVLFIGSSRTQNAVDTGALQRTLTESLGQPVRAFNFALAGCGPVTNAVYLRRLHEHGAKPDVVLLEVHPVFLAGQRPDPPETRWLLPIRLRTSELPIVGAMGFPAEASPAAGWRGWLASWFEYRFILIDRYADPLRMVPKLNDGHDPDEHGFVRAREVPPQERSVLEELTRRQYADYFPGYRPDGPGTAALRDMIETCQRLGWKPVIFLPPESTAFRGWYDAAGRQHLHELLHGMAADYGVPLLDCRDWLPDDRIGDGHHLCGSGADLLTQRLAREARNSWLSSVVRPAPPRTP